MSFEQRLVTTHRARDRRQLEDLGVLVPEPGSRGDPFDSGPRQSVPLPVSEGEVLLSALDAHLALKQERGEW